MGDAGTNQHAGFKLSLAIDKYHAIDFWGIGKAAANGAFFVGRPVLPRRITARLTVNF